MLYFLHFYFKSVFITAKNTFFFQELALITFELTNERHLIPLLIKKSNYEIKKFKEISKHYKEMSHPYI